MSTLRFADPRHWNLIEEHLAGARSERFAFALTSALSNGSDGPVLLVEDVELVADDEVEGDFTGWTISDRALDRVHNRAVKERRGLVEFHNHQHGAAPGFSPTDEASLRPMAEYVVDLLPGRPYGAAVWVDGAVHAEWFRRHEGVIERRPFRSVTVLGNRLRVLNCPDTKEHPRFARQIPLLGRKGQAAVRTLRVAVVGEGGTGSHAVSLLAYLGIRDFLLLDDDLIEDTNLNRVVTAELADLGAPKTLVARRRVLSLDPSASVRVLPGLTPRGDHPELLEVDLIIGCVDHDGPRYRLNELAIKSGVPYIDVATGVDANIDPPAIGGRVSFVLPGGPCLTCTEELDPGEVGRWFKSQDQQALDRAHGYGTGEPAPSVVHLNGIAVNAAISEVVAWITGARPPGRRLDIDLNGDASVPGTRVAPSKDTRRRSGCVDCSWRYRSGSPDPGTEMVQT